MQVVMQVAYLSCIANMWHMVNRG